MSLESHLQTKLLLEAPKRFKDLRLFRRNVGSAVMKGGYTVQFAIPGQCDLYGYVRGGRTIEVELKNVGEGLKPDQKIWRAWCVEWGIPHIVLTAMKNETDQQTIDRWCAELLAFIPR